MLKNQDKCVVELPDSVHTAKGKNLYETLGTNSAMALAIALHIRAMAPVMSKKKGRIYNDAGWLGSMEGPGEWMEYFLSDGSRFKYRQNIEKPRKGCDKPELATEFFSYEGSANDGMKLEIMILNHLSKDIINQQGSCIWYACVHGPALELKRSGGSQTGYHSLDDGIIGTSNKFAIINSEGEETIVQNKLRSTWPITGENRPTNEYNEDELFELYGNLLKSALLDLLHLPHVNLAKAEHELKRLKRPFWKKLLGRE
ncbi:MAG: hypothetical protein KAT43_06490 [Nanoarchaeota archaeon]|nr:hypothetical protein [Nanoarchaeota archaeon]